MGTLEMEAKTEDKLQPRHKGIKAMPFVIGNETFEKLGTIGTSSNLLVYLTTVFNMKSVTAATLINAFSGTTNLSPLLGAFLSDTYLGRYATLSFASLSSFTGMLVLTLTAVIPRLHPPSCGGGGACEGPSPGQMAFLLAAFGFLIVGAGGIRPCNLAFGADQFDPGTEAGKRGIASFFNWYYFTFTFAMMVSLTLIVYVQSSVSWGLGLAIPTFLMFLSCAFFFLGTRMYVKVKPEGSPLRGVAGVVAAAVRKRPLPLPERPGVSLYNHVPANSINSRLAHTDQFRFLDKAAIKTAADKLEADGSAANPHLLCTMQRVEEVKCLIRVLPIWVAGLIYFIAIIQNQTYVVFQALQSDRRLHRSSAFTIPAATYIAFSMLALTIWIPIYDRLIVPSLRRITGRVGGITVLQKMGVGFALVIASMVVGAVVERRRRIVALTGPTLGVAERKGEISSFSALWLVPQLAIAGMAEAFASVGMTEFYYRQFPENMRSIGSAFFLAGIAAGNYLCGLLVTVVHRVTAEEGGENWLAQDLNRARLDRFYFMVAAIEVLNFGYFLVAARWYKYKGTGGDRDGDCGGDGDRGCEGALGSGAGEAGKERLQCESRVEV